MAGLSPMASRVLNQGTAASAISHAQPIPESQYGFGVLDTYRAVHAWANFLRVNP